MPANKIILVNAHKKSAEYLHNNPTEHLGLGYLAAYLRKFGYSNVEIIDGYALALSTEQIFDEVRAAAPDLIGITLEYNTFEEAIKLARLVKGVHPHARVVLGGEHATYATVEILETHPEIDFIVRGEGEVTFLELCELTFNGSGQPLADVLGVAYRDASGKAVQNKDRPAIEDLDTLPFPARDTLERALKAGLRPAIAMLGSRGCPAKCSFCNAYKFFNIGGGARWRPRSAENIVDELEMLLNKYQGLDIYPVVYFGDENFPGPKRGLPRVREFAERIIRKGLSVEYEIFCRTDSFNGQDELVDLLRQSGLISVLMGIEAGSDDQLKLLNKGSSASKNLSSVEIFQKYNVVTSSSGFLMFNPYTTFRDLRRNVSFLLRIQHATLYNMSCRVHAYPGLEMNKDLADSGMLTSEYTHYKVDSIAFVNKHVQGIADLLTDLADVDLLRREDSTMRDIDINMARTLSVIGGNLLEGDMVQQCEVAALFAAKAAVQRRSADFFLALVEQAEAHDLTRDGFITQYATYAEAIRQGLDHLDNVFHETMLNIKHYLDETFLTDLVGEPLSAQNLCRPEQGHNGALSAASMHSVGEVS
ncbi:radical SAM protein [Burkholderia stagnalis]|uniref:B12-binding domain-containing radical SAM protein n=1 Tax=Burkholderia stagnalis TaxID=1503054 RepID=UPI000F55A268|nr:radical SAM protein [Burkholderia stagnalis]RQP99667.1 radical SAM protein [Burkholderia stagnalis]RQQ07982.1 radical SAM protein [Burkholderia stagnalis]RQQ22665.1 radical SAM protein [Burkholderia stagnalis]RQQ24979.1 radical SAM protein [Burkholderia stagnalis]RQQ26373.1 radical SAM protein [Burkholderia stagnalis]